MAWSSLPTSTSPPETYTLSLHDALPISSEQLVALDDAHGAAVVLVAECPDGPVVVVAEDVLAAELGIRSEEHTSELQSQSNLVCRLLLEKKNRRPGRLPLRPERLRQSRHRRLALHARWHGHRYLRLPRPPRPTLFPYTTLFRSPVSSWSRLTMRTVLPSYS